MCFCHIYFNLGNIRSCFDMYLGIFVNRIEVEVDLGPGSKSSTGPLFQNCLLTKSRVSAIFQPVAGKWYFEAGFLQIQYFIRAPFHYSLKRDLQKVWYTVSRIQCLQ